MATITVQRQRKVLVNGSFEYDQQYPTLEGYTWTGQTYRSIGGAKRSLTAKHKAGLYGLEVWEFVIVETTFDTGFDVGGEMWVDVHVYERKVETNDNDNDNDYQTARQLDALYNAETVDALDAVYAALDPDTVHVDVLIYYCRKRRALLSHWGRTTHPKPQR